MSAVFVSGSRQISRLNRDVCARLDRIIESDLSVLIGDANGVDKAIQTYLANISYKQVTVFFVGDECRNNVGGWKQQKIATASKLKGRELYAAKDKAMAELAGYGFVVWDGKSAGSISNVIELISQGKCAVVYLAPSKDFQTIKSPADIESLLALCDKEDIQALNEKLDLSARLQPERRDFQLAFDL